MLPPLPLSHIQRGVFSGVGMTQEKKEKEEEPHLQLSILHLPDKRRIAARDAVWSERRGQRGGKEGEGFQPSVARFSS